MYIPQINLRYDVPITPHATSLTTELYAIYMAVKYIITENILNAVILTDSQESINRIKFRNTLKHSDSSIPHLITSLINNTNRNLNITLIWIPGHFNIEGNVIADSVAKTSSILPFSLKRVTSLGDFFNQFKKDMKTYSEQQSPRDI